MLLGYFEAFSKYFAVTQFIPNISLPEKVLLQQVSHKFWKLTQISKVKKQAKTACITFQNRSIMVYVVYKYNNLYH